MAAMIDCGDNGESLRFSTELTHRSLQGLCNGDILTIRVPNYYSEVACNKILNNLDKQQQLTEKYDNAPELDIYRLGMAFFETRFNKALKETYFSLSEQFNEVVGDICYPHATPLEKFVADLEEHWPAGATIQTLEDKKMMPGLVRIFLQNQPFPPHQDMLTRDVPDLPKEEHPISQLAVNIYLRNFDEGGELEIWDYAPDDEEVKQLYTGTHDFIDRDKIPVSSLKIKPNAGELIIVQSSKLHSVRPGIGGDRVAFSCFSAYRGENEPLTYWI
ncbi:2OG-Fe(II) oxygenase [Leucothrix sargassi]|nr:2OG-Fe(II) oxygenase [Leucothrix sargassi]